MQIFALLAALCVLASPVYAGMSRQDIIDRQMNCVDNSRHSPDGAITWSDICSTVPSPDEARLKTVNAQLDQIERPGRVVVVEKPEQLSETPPQAMPAAQDAPQGIRQPRIHGPYKSMGEVADFGLQALDPRHTHTFDVSQEVYYYKYHESIPITNHGVMVGFNAKYAYRPPDGSFLNNAVMNTYMLEARTAGGKLDYKGSGHVDGKPNKNFELRGLLGKDFLFTNQTLITPYFGLGYRYLLDKGNDRQSTTGLYGYDRRSNYVYLPIGVTFQGGGGPVSAKLNLEYDWFLGGTQYSDLSAVSPYDPPNIYPNIKNEQTKGHGARGSLKLLYSFRHFNIFIEPFMRYWSISDSKEVTETIGVYGPVTLLEPRNYTMEVGSGFGIEF